MKELKAGKRILVERVENGNKVLKVAKENDRALKESNGKPFREVISKIEQVLKKKHIDKPHYYGGKHNGKNCLMKIPKK